MRTRHFVTITFSQIEESNYRMMTEESNYRMMTEESNYRMMIEEKCGSFNLSLVRKLTNQIRNWIASSGDHDPHSSLSPTCSPIPTPSSISPRDNDFLVAHDCLN